MSTMTVPFSGRQILINTGLLFSSSTIARVLSALSLFVIARKLGPEAFGLYAASISLVKLTSVFFSLGLDAWMLRNGSREKKPIATVFGACLGLKSSLGAIWLLGLVLATPYLNQDAFPTSLVLLSAVSMFFDELASVAWSTFKAFLRNRVTAWLLVGAQGLQLIVVLILAYGAATTAAVFLTGKIAASAISCGISLFLLIRVFGCKIQYSAMIEVLRETVSFALSQGLAIIYERVDILIIAYWLGKVAAGLYSPAVSLMTTLFLIPLAIYEVMLPIISRSHASDPASIEKTSFRLLVVSGALGMMLGIGLTIFSYPLVWIFYGAEYVASGEVLAILSSVLVFKSVSFALAAVITAVGWQGKRVIVQGVAASMNILINILIVEKYGILGVAKIYVLTEAVIMIGYAILVLKWQYKNNLRQSGRILD